MIEATYRSPEDFAWVKLIMNEHEIQIDIKNYLEDLRSSALNSLSEIKVENKPQDYLVRLVDFAINRSY